MLGALIGGGLSAIGGLLGGNAEKKAAAANRKQLNRLRKDGLGYIDAGQEQSQGYLEGVGDLYRPVAEMGLGNLGYYADALGLNGQEGSSAALDRFQTGPGYEFAMNQGLDAVNRSAAARGQLNSGNTSMDTLNFATGLANQEWGGYLDRLGGYDQSNRNMYMQGIGGQAGSLSDLAGLAQNATGQRLNLIGEVTNGLMGANNQYASGSQMQIGGGLGGLAKGLGGMFGGYL